MLLKPLLTYKMQSIARKQRKRELSQTFVRQTSSFSKAGISKTGKFTSTVSIWIPKLYHSRCFIVPSGCPEVLWRPLKHSENEYIFTVVFEGVPGGSDGKESTCNAGDLGLIPGLGSSPGEKNAYPLQYSCLENPTNRGFWWATVYRVTKSQTELSD